jgi:hypothetical protein
MDLSFTSPWVLALGAAFLLTFGLRGLVRSVMGIVGMIAAFFLVMYLIFRLGAFFFFSTF